MENHPKNPLVAGRSFFYGIALFAVTGGFSFLFLSKGEVVLWMNDRYTPFLNLFFKYVTFLGDGIFISILVFALLFIKVRYFTIALFCATLTGILVQFLKRSVFALPRPLGYFEPGTLELVEGVDIHAMFSFPSGHTAGAFAIYGLLAIFGQNNRWGWGLFLLSFIVGLSRIYLAQHFWVDVYAGALLGSTLCVLSYYLVGKISFLQHASSEKSVLSWLTKKKRSG